VQTVKERHQMQMVHIGQNINFLRNFTNKTCNILTTQFPLKTKFECTHNTMCLIMKENQIRAWNTVTF